MKDFDPESGWNNPVTELNGKNSEYRFAPMLSEPRSVPKRRIRGALVPIQRDYQ